MFAILELYQPLACASSSLPRGKRQSVEAHAQARGTATGLPSCCVQAAMVWCSRMPAFRIPLFVFACFYLPSSWPAQRLLSKPVSSMIQIGKRREDRNWQVTGVVKPETVVNADVDTCQQPCQLTAPRRAAPRLSNVSHRTRDGECCNHPGSTPPPPPSSM